jgi:hypothetical protein
MNSEQLPKGVTKLGPNCPHDRIDILSCSNCYLDNKRYYVSFALPGTLWVVTFVE